MGHPATTCRSPHAVGHPATTCQSPRAVGHRYALGEIAAGLFPAEGEVSPGPALPPQLVSDVSDFVTQFCRLIPPPESKQRCC